MTNKNFILLSLDDDRAKKVANAVSNVSCKKILDYLAAANQATETEISSAMKLPISTIHYNLQLLVEAGLVECDEFHYSKKGKEVNHYKLANKYIIITPKKEKSDGIKEKLKAIFPVAIIMVAAAGLIQLATMMFGKTSAFSKAAAPEAGRLMAALPAPAADSMVENTAFGAGIAEESLAATAAATGEPEVIKAIVFEPNIALWFLIGALSALAIYFLIAIIRKKRV